MSIAKLTETEIRKNFNLKKHQEVEGVKSCRGMNEADAEIKRIVAQAEAEGYEVRVKKVGNQIHIDKTKRTIEEKIIDGHFWVEYRGKNMDLTTDVLIERMKRKGDRCVYLPAPQPEADEFIEKVYNRLREKHIAKGYDWEEWVDEMVERYESGDLSSFDCVGGAMVLKRKLGEEAKIRYGQVGAVDKDGMIYWYFGHPDEDKSLWEKPQGTDIKKDGYCFHKTHISRHSSIIYDPRTPPLIKKQKPNEKCLCGSSKKYKVCCGKK